MNKAGTGSARDATELGSGQLNNQAALPKARSKSDSPRKRQAYGLDQGNESGRLTLLLRTYASHLAFVSLTPDPSLSRHFSSLLLPPHLFPLPHLLQFFLRFLSLFLLSFLLLLFLYFHPLLFS